MTAFTVVIPARMASQRLPHKPLMEIDGLPMVVRVARQAQQSAATRVLVATDHEAVRTACMAHDIEAVMTRASHVSGTDRLAEVVDLLALPAEEILVNVQGDEPLVDPASMNRLAVLLTQREAPMATLAHPIGDAAALFNPHAVKVVLNRQGYALYFSRAPIPFARDAFAMSCDTLPDGLPVLRHIGMYAYRAGFLKTYAALAPAPLETFEALEQLRALWHGYAIAVAVLEEAPAGGGVDTPEDLARIRRHFTLSAQK